MYPCSVAARQTQKHGLRQTQYFVFRFLTLLRTGSTQSKGFLLVGGEVESPFQAVGEEPGLVYKLSWKAYSCKGQVAF